MRWSWLPSPSHRFRGGSLPLPLAGEGYVRPSARLRAGRSGRERAGVSGSWPRTAVSDIKEQETRATQVRTVFVFYRRSSERPVRW